MIAEDTVMGIPAAPYDARLWASLGWARIEDPADQNPDLLPEDFRIDFGCPECGSAWVDLLAAGYTSTRVYGGKARWAGGKMDIEPDPMIGIDFRAARLRCCEGHTYEIDALTGKIRRADGMPPYWLSAVVGLGAVAYVASQLGFRRKPR